jgi:hypothetical protein
MGDTGTLDAQFFGETGGGEILHGEKLFETLVHKAIFYDIQM